MIERSWRKFSTTFGLFITLLVTCTATAVQNPVASDDAIVRQFFPQSLIDESEKDAQAGGPAPFQDSSFVTAELNGPGNGQFIVAAYTNGFGGAVRVLRKQNGSAALVSEPNLRMGGVFSEIDLVDVDNDNKPEVDVSFSSANGHFSTWLFKWTGTELVSIGPTTTRDGDILTQLRSPAFFDLDGDGVLEAVNGVETDDEPIRIFALQNGTYRLWKNVNFFSTYVRHEGRPENVEDTFSVLSPGLYTLRVVNGDRYGKNRVSSAEIRLNGSVVVTPNRFNQQVREIVLPVSIVSTNVVSADLQGAPGGQFIITIEPRN